MPTAPFSTGSAQTQTTPPRVFARSFRLTGRLHRRQPQLSNVLLRNGFAIATADRGIVRRARRDIEAAH
jgi:hypothetical protein